METVMSNEAVVVLNPVSAYCLILMSVGISSLRSEKTIDSRRLINRPKLPLCKR